VKTKVSGLKRLTLEDKDGWVNPEGYYFAHAWLWLKQIEINEDPVVAYYLASTLLQPMNSKPIVLSSLNAIFK
jgi:hypothetical protein